MFDPGQAIDIVNARFGAHARHRALHAKGTWCRGTFTASPAAAGLCRAAHLQGDAVPVLARFSNGGGDPGVPDYAPDVRGFAVGFELADGTRTDLVMQSIPRFFSSTPQEFLEFIQAATGRAAALQLPRYLAAHPKALRSLPVNGPALRPVHSYAHTRFYGVHAFRWLDADGGARYVRCDWRPEAGQRWIGPRDARSRGRDYLQTGLADQLPARFVLDVQVADAGDVVDDPSVHWPAARRRVDAGVLEITEVLGDQEADGEVVVFDPLRVTDGIEPSQDPVLAYRPRAYSESVTRRTA